MNSNLERNQTFPNIQKNRDKSFTDVPFWWEHKTASKKSTYYKPFVMLLTKIKCAPIQLKVNSELELSSCEFSWHKLQVTLETFRPHSFSWLTAYLNHTAVVVFAPMHQPNHSTSMGKRVDLMLISALVSFMFTPSFCFLLAPILLQDNSEQGSTAIKSPVWLQVLLLWGQTCSAFSLRTAGLFLFVFFNGACFGPIHTGRDARSEAN